jgi:hypothetical protein
VSVKLLDIFSTFQDTLHLSAQLYSSYDGDQSAVIGQSGSSFSYFKNESFHCSIIHASEYCAIIYI